MRSDNRPPGDKERLEDSLIDFCDWKRERRQERREKREEKRQ